MLTVRVLPREGVTLRAAAATVEVTAALAAGHLWAGGSLPSLPWLAVMAAAVFGTGLLVLRGRVRPRVAVPLLVAAQLLLHAWLTALTMGTDPMGHMAAGAHAGHAHALLDPSMLVVHVGGGLLTALLWELRARAGEVVVTWTRQPLPPLPSLRLVPAPVPAPSALLSRFVVAAAPRRGPPAALATA
ncbi:hypothetical protein [Nocardioides sp.]|uniref:hypothetical protein n=1 Tax=Nocardioides sp. TaxID=35761 RepID=UPI00271FA35B|nr:hypothetical protein [Nocardioides sp.]MDO9455881.1 hypothetical protein [Nocardioides sp.]